MSAVFPYLLRGGMYVRIKTLSACMYVCIYMNICRPSVYVCMYVCMYVCIHFCLFIQMLQLHMYEYIVTPANFLKGGYLSFGREGVAEMNKDIPSIRTSR